jgi:hypothetical protein
MKKNKITISEEKLSKLQEMFQNIPEKPIGNHLSEEDFINFASEKVPQSDFQRIDDHLSSCKSCLLRMEQVLEMTAEWQTTKGKKRIADFQAQLLEGISEEKIVEEKENEAAERVIECVFKTANIIDFGIISGLSGQFVKENPRFRKAMPYGKEDKKVSPFTPSGIGNDDYHIDVSGGRDNEIFVKVSSKTDDKDLKGITVYLYDDDNNLIGSTSTDSEGEASITLKNNC